MQSLSITSFAPAIIASQLYGIDTVPRFSQLEQKNALVTAYTTRDMALEASSDGIRCNSIAPTYVDTPNLRQAIQTGPYAQRMAKAVAHAKLGLPTPQELAEDALFICSPAAKAHHRTGD